MANEEQSVAVDNYQVSSRKRRSRLSLLAIALIGTMLLTACGKFTCDFCGEEKSGKSYTTTLLGEKLTICSDCYKELNG